MRYHRLNPGDLATFVPRPGRTDMSMWSDYCCDGRNLNGTVVGWIEDREEILTVLAVVYTDFNMISPGNDEAWLLVMKNRHRVIGWVWIGSLNLDWESLKKVTGRSDWEHAT